MGASTMIDSVLHETPKKNEKVKCTLLIIARIGRKIKHENLLDYCRL